MPARAPELEVVAERGTGVAADHPAPDDRLTGARREHPPFHDAHVVVHGERDGLDASHEDVLPSSLARAKERLHDELGRGKRLVLHVTRDAVEEADRLVGLKGQLARPVVVGALPHDDDVPRVARRDERPLEARDEAEEEAARDHDERDHARRHEGASAPGPHVAEAVRQRQPHGQNTSCSVATTGFRAAPNAGTTPASMPTKSDRKIPWTMTELVTTRAEDTAALRVHRWLTGTW